MPREPGAPHADGVRAVPALRAWGAVGWAVAALIGAGCASSDLTADAKVRSEVVECLPTDTPAPTVVERAIWFPNASGFGSTDASPLGHASGVLALAGDKLWFMSWNESEHHYDMMHDIDILRAANVSVARLGTSAMLVVQSGNLSYDAFELMEGGQFSSDPRATEDLCARLQALRAKSPQPDS